MRLATTPAVALATALSFACVPSALAAGTGENVRHVKNIEFPELHDASERNAGTDVEFVELAGKQYAIAGSYGDGTHLIDISAPESSQLVATWDCGMSQADPQVFERDGRTYVSTTMDDGYTFHRTSKCVGELAGLGVKVGNGYGTFIAELVPPATTKKRKGVRTTSAPSFRTVGFVPLTYEGLLAEGASHNHTIHPNGKYLYNSNSDLITSLSSRTPAIEVFDITDFTKPVLVDEIALKPIPGLGAESHDITFDADGKRAYTAALSHAMVIDTTDPTNNKPLGTVVDPTINVFHQADPVTIKDPVLGARKFLVIEDEVAGALGTGQCPNGGVHVYDITGPLENAPVKVGYWNIDDVDTTDGSLPFPTGCTAHVFDIHEKEAIMTIAYYNGGVRVVDMSNLVGVALGKTGVGMKELGYYRFKGGSDFSDTWSVKAPSVSRDGFFMYGNDQNRGFDVYEYEPVKARLTGSRSTWMSPAQHAVLSRQARAQGGAPTLAAVCLLNSKTRRQLQAGTKAAGLKLVTDLQR